MRQRRKLLLRTTTLVAALAISLGAAAAVLGVHDDEFQLDGNVAADPPGAPPFDGAVDWESLFSDPNFSATGAGNAPVVGALPAGFTDADFVEDWSGSVAGGFVTSDSTTFTGGSSKDIHDVSEWRCVGANNVTDKGDLTNVYATLYEAGGERIFYFGAEKTEDNGTNNIGLWLLQGNASCPPGGTGNGTAFSGTHVVGDIFLVSQFTNGGGVSTILAYEWVADNDPSKAGDQPGLAEEPFATGVDCRSAGTGVDDELCATVNSSLNDVPTHTPEWTHYSKKFGINSGIERSTFFEGGIDLSEFDEFNDSCFTGFLMNTRSSVSLTAELYDYALGDIDTCNPEVSIDKEPETGTHNVGDSFNWTLTVTNDGDGPADNATVSDTIPAGLTIGTVTVNPATGNSCAVNGQVVTCSIDLAAADGNTTAPEPDVAVITIPVTSTLAVFPQGSAGCVDVNNTGMVSVTGDTNASDNSDTVVAKICRPVLSKNATASYTETHTWDVQKSVSPTPQDGFAGDSFNFTWSIDVTETVQESAFAVTGTISVQNPSPSLPMTVALSDELNDAGTTDATITQCANGTLVAGSVTVAAGQTALCSYTASPTGRTATQNNVTGTMNSLQFTASAALSWTATVINPSVTLDDDQKPTGFPVVVDGSEDDVSYGDTYTCSTDPDDYTNGTYHYEEDNTAVLIASGQTIDSDDATEVIDCYIPSISKTAAGSDRELHTWTVEKTVTPVDSDGWAGDVLPYQWTITVDETVVEDSHAVTGTISVGNPNPSDALVATLTDTLDDGTPVTISGCTGTGVTFVAGTITVPAGGSASCSYSAEPSDDDATLNTATLTKNAINYVATDAVEWTTDVVNPSVTLDDDQNGALPQVVTGDASFPYDDSYTCSTNQGDYGADGTYSASDYNLATISANNQVIDSDDATANFDCYLPLVEKTADGSYDKKWTWTIDKVATDGVSTTPISELDLMPDQTFLVEYAVTVDATSENKNFEVTGKITVTNPHPDDDITVDVTDQLSNPAVSLTAAQITCGAVDGDDLVVPNGESVECTYSFTDLAGVSAGGDGTNTATVTKGSLSVSDTDGYTFSLDNEKDECVALNDTPYGQIGDGTYCASEGLPKTFKYEVTLNTPEDPLDCGETEIPNVADFVTNDTGTTGEAPWTITVTIHCAEGCSLTQGYWKTHSSYGPAPEDPNWLLLPDVDGDGIQEGPDETFFKSGQTWYQVFWTKPAGNAYYNLAKQYMAAVLNGVAGADTSVVDDEISDAEDLFEVYTPAQIAKLKGNKPPRPAFISLAGTLASYNEGSIGPGHCDEDRLSSREA